MELLERFRNGDQRALARAITLVENDHPDRPLILADLHPLTGRAHVVGITGAPGVGKSTLVDQLASEARRRDKTVGIVAVDPSSPFSGGAVLGDRIRMERGASDRGVFIRSLSARGHAGGISAATGDVVSVLDAFGFDLVLVETVGAGQSEVEVMRLVHTTMVVTIPGLGDDVQAIKAGILEIGDLFVVNKADRDGADRTAMELEMMLDLGEGHGGARMGGTRAGGSRGAGTGAAGRWDPRGHHAVSGVPAAGGAPEQPGRGPDQSATSPEQSETAPAHWRPPVLKSVARDGQGVVEVMDAVASHLAYLHDSGRWQVRQRQEAENKLRRLVADRLLATVLGPAEENGDLARLAAAVADREQDPFTAARHLLQRYWPGDDRPGTK